VLPYIWYLLSQGPYVTTGCSHEPMDQSLVRFDAFKDFLISAYNLGFLVVFLTVGVYERCRKQNADPFLALVRSIRLQRLQSELISERETPGEPWYIFRPVHSFVVLLHVGKSKSWPCLESIASFRNTTLERPLRNLNA
jgi:hypothetical protein